MTRSPAFAALLTAALALTACSSADPSPAPTGPPSPQASPQGKCVDGFRITPGPVDSASGLRAVGLSLLNCGATAYAVKGFPVVRVLDEDGAVVDVTVGAGSEPVSAPDSWDTPPEALSVAPGGVAEARVLWRNTVDATDKSPVSAAFLAIKPSADAPEQVVAIEGGIDLGTTGRLAVNAWRADARS